MTDKELVSNQGLLTFQLIRVRSYVTLQQAMRGDLTTTYVYFGRAMEIMDRRKEIKRSTVRKRQRDNER
jgi:hypothetical protein